MYVESRVATGMSGGQPEISYRQEVIGTKARTERIKLLKRSSMSLKKQVPLMESNPVRNQGGDALTFFDIHKGLKFTVFIKTSDEKGYTRYVEGEVVTGPEQEETHDEMWWFRADLRDPSGQEWKGKLCCMGVFGITKFDRPGAQSPEWNDSIFVVEGYHDAVPKFNAVSGEANSSELTQIPVNGHRAA